MPCQVANHDTATTHSSPETSHLIKMTTQSYAALLGARHDIKVTAAAHTGQAAAAAPIIIIIQEKQSKKKVKPPGQLGQTTQLTGQAGPPDPAGRPAPALSPRGGETLTDTPSLPTRSPPPPLDLDREPDPLLPRSVPDAVARRRQWTTPAPGAPPPACFLLPTGLLPRRPSSPSPPSPPAATVPANPCEASPLSTPLCSLRPWSPH